MTGESEAPFSAAGTGGLESSSSTDPPVEDRLGFDVAWRAIGIEDAVELVLDAKDIVETWLGQLTGLLLVPREEQQRWLEQGGTDGS